MRVTSRPLRKSTDSSEMLYVSCVVLLQSTAFISLLLRDWSSIIMSMIGSVNKHAKISK